MGVPEEKELGGPVFEEAPMESEAWPHLFGP